MQEQWKQFKDYPVEVSTFGRVRFMLTKQIIPQFDNGYGYLRVSIPTNMKTHICNLSTGNYSYYDIDGLRFKQKSEYVHRLVAMTFILNPENKPLVDHIDTDKANNFVENLRWVNQSENNLNPITNLKSRDARTSKVYKEIMHNKLLGNQNGKHK